MSVNSVGFVHDIMDNKIKALEKERDELVKLEKYSREFLQERGLFYAETMGKAHAENAKLRAVLRDWVEAWNAPDLDSNAWIKPMEACAQRASALLEENK